MLALVAFGAIEAYAAWQASLAQQAEQNTLTQLLALEKQVLPQSGTPTPASVQSTASAPASGVSTANNATAPLGV